MSRREIRCAEDRLVIRAIAQVLKPVFGQALSKDCMHLSGNGGGKAAVTQTQDYISQHPGHQVIKSDVKRYYASIDHVILHEQLHQLLPNEKTLNRLLWNFMRRTVEFGGNYREVEIGLPLGASLSPLFSALYLSPLDELAKNTPNTFYRRYMDDWVWVFPKKQTLRTTMKKQYGILHALRVAMHPDKTFIGKVKKGFDFLRVNLTPTGVTVSQAALSRHEDKVARLYEQDAKPKRIRAYRLRWLVWAGLAMGSSAHADQTPYGACSTRPFTLTIWSNNRWLSGVYTGSDGLACIPSMGRIPTIGARPVQPFENATCSESVIATMTTTAYYLSRSSTSPDGQYCLYELTSNGEEWVSSKLLSGDHTGPAITSGATASFPENATGTVYTATASDDTTPVTYALTGGGDQALFTLTTAGVLTFNASPDFESPGDVDGDNVYNIEITASDGVTPTANTTKQNVAVTVTNDTTDDATLTSSPSPQNIPIFGPFGLLAMLLGLLWFGKRRRQH